MVDYGQTAYITVLNPVCTSIKTRNIEHVYEVHMLRASRVDLRRTRDTRASVQIVTAWNTHPTGQKPQPRFSIQSSPV